MQRIAVSMIGGMVSSTLLTLIVIPAIYGLAKGGGPLKRADVDVLSALRVSSERKLAAEW